MEHTLLSTLGTGKGDLIAGGSKTALPTNPEVVHVENTTKTDAQEDWLRRMATTDLVSWLKGIYH